ncbi:MAG: PAS domain S-box protein [Vicinamibacterales bacterium]
MAQSPRVEEAVLLREQVEDHVKLVPLAVGGIFIVILTLAVVYWPLLGHGVLLTWCTSLAVPFLARAAVARAYTTHPQALPLAAWRGWFRLTYAIHGAAWVLASLIVVGALDITEQVFATCVLAGIIATSLNTAAFDRTAGLLVLVPSVASWSVRMFVEGERLHTALGLMLALFLAYMALYAVRIHRTYQAGVALRAAAAARAEALTAFQTAFARLWRTEHGDTRELERVVTREVAAALHARRVCLVHLDHDAGLAAVTASAGEAPIDPASAPPCQLAPLAPYLQTLSTDGRVAADDAAGLVELTGIQAGPLAAVPGLARLDLPIGATGRIAGVLCCERGAGPWSTDEQAFVTAAAATLQAADEEARRRDAERRLRDLNLNLEQAVAARTSALAASEARLAQALDATNDGLWDFSLDTGGVYYSPVLARLLGYAPEEVPATVEFFWSRVHPEDVPRLQDVNNRHLSGELPAKELEVRLRMKAGEYRWFLDQGKVVQRAADGRPLRMLGTISDITARKRALEDLHESEARFRELFDKSPIGVALVDLADARIAETNEACLQVLGYARDEIIGRTAAELGLWVDDADRARAARQLSETGTVDGAEARMRRKSGAEFWGLLHASVITVQGRPFSLNTLQDVTERRELEARVLQAQKMEVVGHLAGGVAHDFNNVLTVIASTAELALPETHEGDPLHEALQTIRAASTRAARLTGQLLAFSRQQILQPAPTDLNELVHGLAPMIQRVAGDTVVVETATAAGPATVMADRGSLEQVVLNLAINARDAMPDGGTLTVAIATTTLPQHGGGTTLDAGRYATLAVTDTGTGMPDATRRRIFEPFFTTKEVGKGTGLGLSMVHGVVRQSGGDITVDSTPGAGSRFTIYLPLTSASPVRITPPPRQVAAGHETVLIVDDDADIRQMLKRALSFAGYEVAVAGDGEEALAELARRGGHVDLVLTDVMMPGIGGPELAARIRASDPQARILFTSGYAENAVAHHGVLAEGVQFIAKPYSLQALTQKVRETLDA